MKRYHVFRDGQLIGSMPTKEEAIELIRRRQTRETHYIKSNYSYIYGEEVFIKYPA